MVVLAVGPVVVDVVAGDVVLVGVVVVVRPKV